MKELKTKLLEENIGVNPCGLKLVKIFLDKTEKAQVTKDKNT